MSTCRSCGAEIVWAKSASSGKAVPLDAAETTAPGALILTEGDIAWSVSSAERHGITGGTAHLSHFVTCPQAANWRKS